MQLTPGQVRTLDLKTGCPGYSITSWICHLMFQILVFSTLSKKLCTQPSIMFEICLNTLRATKDGKGSSHKLHQEFRQVL